MQIQGMLTPHVRALATSCCACSSFCVAGMKSCSVLQNPVNPPTLPRFSEPEPHSTHGLGGHTPPLLMSAELLNIQDGGLLHLVLDILLNGHLQHLVYLCQIPAGRLAARQGVRQHSLRNHFRSPREFREWNFLLRPSCCEPRVHHVAG